MKDSLQKLESQENIYTSAKPTQLPNQLPDRENVISLDSENENPVIKVDEILKASQTECVESSHLSTENQNSEAMIIPVSPDIFQRRSQRINRVLENKSPKNVKIGKRLVAIKPKPSGSTPETTVLKGSTKKPICIVGDSKQIIDKVLKTRSLIKPGEKKPLLLRFGIDNPTNKPANPANSNETICQTESGEDKAKKQFVVKSIFRLFDNSTDGASTSTTYGMSKITDASASDASSRSPVALKPKTPGLITVSCERNTKSSGLDAKSVVLAPKPGTSHMCETEKTTSDNLRISLSGASATQHTKSPAVSQLFVGNTRDTAGKGSNSTTQISSVSPQDSKKSPEGKVTSLSGKSESLLSLAHKNMKFVSLKLPYPCPHCNRPINNLNEYLCHVKNKCKQIQQPENI